MKTCASKGTRNPTCITHGGAVGPDNVCATYRVLDEVARERARQFAQYGTNADLQDGTGADAYWLYPFSLHTALTAQAGFRADYEGHEQQHGAPTWMHLVREEIAEAFQESDPARLEEELVQVAALCVSWVEKIRARQE